MPGNDTVSIRRGIRVPKFIAMKSMDEILTEFLKENPNCSFKKRVLLREVPQNIVRPTARDFCGTVASAIAMSGTPSKPCGESLGPPFSLVTFYWPQGRLPAAGLELQLQGPVRAGDLHPGGGLLPH